MKGGRGQREASRRYAEQRTGKHNVIIDDKSQLGRLVYCGCSVKKYRDSREARALRPPTIAQHHVVFLAKAQRTNNSKLVLDAQSKNM